MRHFNINMLTLKQHTDNVKICDIRSGKKLQDVYWNPKRVPELQNSVEDVSSFFTPEFLDKFELSKEQSVDIQSHLKQGTVSEKHQSKFFKIKKFILESLYTEMNIADTSNTFEINFPPGSETWGNNAIIAGATSSGKSYWAMSRVLKNLQGPKKDRRKFCWLSSEWLSDKTLKPIKQEKYKEFVEGLEISDQAILDSEHDTAEEFFEHEIKRRFENAPPGKIFIIDDPVDAGEGLQTPIRNLINRSLRVSRHRQLGLMFVIHRIRSGSWSVQGTNSCKYFVLFPRSQKGKVTQFLNFEMGLTLREARECVSDFSATGRAMVVRMFSPNCLIGDKLIKII